MSALHLARVYQKTISGREAYRCPASARSGSSQCKMNHRVGAGQCVRRRSDEEHMSEANKAVTKRWFEEVWNKRRREAIDEMLSPHAVLYEGGKVSKGPEGFRPFFDRMWEAFSDIRITVQDAIAEGDMVCVRWSCTM